MIESAFEWVLAFGERGLVKLDPERRCECGTRMPFAGKKSTLCHVCLAARRARWQAGRSHKRLRTGEKP
jgi:hypothetical protein